MDHDHTSRERNGFRGATLEGCAKVDCRTHLAF
jgi:hypothetical protein